MIGLSLLCLGVLAITGPIQGSLVKAPAKANCLLFVLRDCPIANKYAPEMQRIIKDYSPKGVQFLLIYEDSDATLNNVTQHSREYGYKIPITIDRGHAEAKKLGVTNSPSVVLEASGKVYYTGRIDDTFPAIGKQRAKATSYDLRNALDAFLEGRPVKVEKTEAVGCRLY